MAIPEAGTWQCWGQAAKADYGAAAGMRVTAAEAHSRAALEVAVAGAAQVIVVPLEEEELLAAGTGAVSSG